MWKFLERFKVQSRLILICILYLALAVTYSVVVPIGKGADEWAHYWYAQFIAQHHRLPANPAERETAGYKSDWPPLYHLLTATVTGWIETAGPPAFKYRPGALPGVQNIRRQLAPAQGAEAIVHTEDELFPWQQEILIWHLGRFLSIGFSVGTLVVTYFMALEIFTSSPGTGQRGAYLAPQTLALVSVAGLAFIPRFLFTGMLFSYDGLTLLLASLFLWLSIRIAKGYAWSWGFWGLGVLAGAALLAKYLTALLPLEIIFLAFSQRAVRQGNHTAVTESLSENPDPNLTGLQDLPGFRTDSKPARPLLKVGQALLAIVLVTSGWFGYLLVNFNEMERYGPILGAVAPLLRGDGSDRTVEQLFAWLSGGQAPAPAHIEQPVYSAWQIISALPTTFWGNPITRPYPLNWLVVVMTVVAGLALLGLIISWRVVPPTPSSNSTTVDSSSRFLMLLLMLHTLLPVPFMAVRLLGARDALEAVQGRHILFLAGPAVAVLLVWGLSRLTIDDLRLKIYDLRRQSPERSGVGFTIYDLRFTFYALLGLLLTGSLVQLIYMAQFYHVPPPVRTTPYVAAQAANAIPDLTLPGGAKLLDFTVDTAASALHVSLMWQGGTEPAPQDYQMQLALVDSRGNIVADWLAYQTQGRYPTRAWEAGDVIRDEGWLPLLGLPTAEYQVQLRLRGKTGAIFEWPNSGAAFTEKVVSGAPPGDGTISAWQTLATYRLSESAVREMSSTLALPPQEQLPWMLWRQGQIVRQTPTLQERETIQFTLAATADPLTPTPHLIGPDGQPYYLPAIAGSAWANFIIEPHWPPGAYRLQPEGPVLFHVAPGKRNFQLPAITHPLEANFENQIKLLGYDLPSRRVQPGEGLPLTLYWQGLQWLDEDFVIFVRLLDNQGVAWGGYDRLAQENYSTLLWAPGEIITDGFAAPVDLAAPAGVYRLSLGWYRAVEGVAQSLPILNPETGQPGDTSAVTIGPIKVGGPPPGVTMTNPNPQVKLNLALDDQIILLGYDLEQSALDACQLASDDCQLPITLYWQALASPALDYTVFIHLRDTAGKIVAQQDNPPAGGVYPTGLWDPGEIIPDQRMLAGPSLPPGQYELVVGMYDLVSGARLPITGSGDNAILLYSFEVSE
jgi:hypothetical protein